MKNKFIGVTFLLLISVISFGQKSDRFYITISGGLKRSIFENALTQVSFYNTSPYFDPRLITPKVKNTIAPFVVAKVNKPISNRWTITNTVGLDMQQLKIISGFKKELSSSTVITGYSPTYYTELLPRLKVDIGLNYQLLRLKNNSVSLGLNAGEMIALSSIANTYSFAESTLNFNGKRMSIFLSGSLALYNVQLKNFESLWGDLEGQVSRANYEFRIKEFGVGLSYRL